MEPVFEILSVGMGVSIQDAGRSGWRRFGVPGAGAMDQYSMRHANRLIGNQDTDAVLEIQLRGAELRVLADTWIGLAGANLSQQLPAWSARKFEKGEVLKFSGAATGLWAYLSVPGGVIADAYFDSVSHDTRSGLGAALSTGDTLHAKSISSAQYERVLWRRSPPDSQRIFPNEAHFELLPGPQYADFPLSATQALIKQSWCVSARSDRTGYRLVGDALPAAAPIASEPVLPGSFQVTGNGSTIVTMGYGPTVGGYPKIALLKEVDLDRFAQCQPGTRLHFTWKNPS